MSKKNKATQLQASDVFVRMRPATFEGGHSMLNPASSKVIQHFDEKSVIIGWSCKGGDDVGKELAAGNGQKHSYMRKVLMPDVSQTDVYQSIVPSQLDKLLGFKCDPETNKLISSSSSSSLYSSTPSDVLLYAYGQTGTGKSFTLIGPDYSISKSLSDAAAASASAAASKNSNSATSGTSAAASSATSSSSSETASTNFYSSIHHDVGLLPRIIFGIFDRLENANRHFVISISAVEFYLMTGFDLLVPRSENPPAVTVDVTDLRLLGLRQVVLRSREDVIPTIIRARDNRHTASTRMNTATKSSPSSSAQEEHSGSSRGHAAFIISVLQLDESQKSYVKSCYHLIDLAGAERPDKTGLQRLSAMEAALQVQEAWRKKTIGSDLSLDVSPSAQAYCINYELYCINETIVTATDANKIGSNWRPSALCNSLGIIFISSLFLRAHLSLIVCLSIAPSCGFESWFSLFIGQTFSKLRSPAVSKNKFFDLETGIKLCKQNIDEIGKVLGISSEFGEETGPAKTQQRQTKNEQIAFKRRAMICTERNTLLLLELLKSKK